MQTESDVANAYAYMLSKRQLKILQYIAENRVAILEKIYKALKIPKTTCKHHVTQLKKLELIEESKIGQKSKPLTLTPLGMAVLKLLGDQPLSEKERVTLSAFDLARKLGSQLNRRELERLVEILTKMLEESKKPLKSEMVV